jgi:multidrug efflux pump subunit AcrA (membrane-fusion protein)
MPTPLAEGDAPTSRWLPKAAVKLTPGSAEATVFTVVDGQAAAWPVQLGARTDQRVEIRSGLQPGMKIIAENLENIENGTPVTVRGFANADDL